MPSQAGSTSRFCVHAKIHGMARRLSTPPDAWRNKHGLKLIPQDLLDSKRDWQMPGIYLAIKRCSSLGGLAMHAKVAVAERSQSSLMVMSG